MSRGLGDVYKRQPAGFDKEHPQASYLKFKSWYLEYPVSDEEVADEGFARRAAEVFEVMKPFNDYLNQALDGFQMPAR